jgi:inhibitor of cysteine peptidase
MELDEAAHGQTIDLAVGDELTIRLAENPTTGYRWDVRSRASTVCDLASDEYEAPKPTPGAGGVHVWAFRATRPGAAELLLVYRRPWDEPSEPEKTFAVRIRVA